MVTDIGAVTADHSPAPIHAMTEVAVLESTSHALLPATRAAHTAVQQMDAPIIPHAIVAPHPALVTSPTGTTHATPWTRAGLTPATPATQHMDHNTRKSSNAQDPQPPINPITPKLSPSRILIQTLHQILTVTLTL